jgi:L-ascorbate metabolism protein UlaG (beta-lactamase superfamily)
LDSNPDLTITWLGHATTQIETPEGKRILIDPWLVGNPSTPVQHKKVDHINLMLITHGHSDHMADAIPIAQQTNPDVIANAEISQYLSSKGIEKCTGMNTGGTVSWNGIQVTLVDAIHSSGIDDDGTMVYGGTAGGFVLKFPDGFTLYHTGDTDVFDGLRLIRQLHQPDVVMMCIGDHYTMGPRKAAEAIRLLGTTRVIPIHWGTFPLLTGTPDALRKEAADVHALKVFDLKPGESITRAELLG